MGRVQGREGKMRDGERARGRGKRYSNSIYVYTIAMYSTAQMCIVVPTFRTVSTKLFISSSTMYKHFRFSLRVHMRSTYKYMYIHERHTG